MPVRARYVTDPACSWSWAAEPVLRRLMVEFGEELRFTYVMGGLARDYTARGSGEKVYRALLVHWLDVADETRMPFDPRLWSEGPIASTYPASMAVLAAAEQTDDGGYRYLRSAREGLMCFRRKLDTTEALVEEARRLRLDVERFRIDLGSSFVVEAFGEHLLEARRVPAEATRQRKTEVSEGTERLSFPSMMFLAEDGRCHGVWGNQPYEAYRAAAQAAGAVPLDGDPPELLAALRRFGRMAAPELEAVCDMPEPRVMAELWALAAEWKVKPVPALTGYLWEAA